MIKHTVSKFLRLAGLMGCWALVNASPTRAADIRVGLGWHERMDRGTNILSGIYQVLAETRGIKPEFIKEFSPGSLGKVDVLLLSLMGDSLDATKGLNPGQAAAIKAWVNVGGGLLCLNDSVGFGRHNTMPLFPEVARGTGNPFPDIEGYARECVVTRAHPLLEGIPPGTRFVVSYFDYIMLEAGPKGIPVVRAVTAAPQGGIVGEPLVVCGKVGKGRYVANGLFTGLSAENQPTSPESLERALLIGSVRWLTGRLPEAAVGSDLKENPLPGTFLPKRNLIFNPSCELVENGKPVDWGGALSCGKIEWGATDKEKHSGRWSAWIKPVEYHLSPGGVQQVGGALLAADSDGYSGPRAIRVNPNTVYHFSFWLKSEIPRLHVFCHGWPDDGLQKGRHHLETSVGRIKPGSDWARYEGQFTTGPDTHRIALALGFATETHAHYQVPLHAAVFVDDVVITQGQRVSSVRELAERSTVKKTLAWKDTLSEPEAALTRVAPGTPVPMNDEYLAFPLYSNLPSGWERIDLAGLWKVRKLDNTTNNPPDDVGMKDGYWKADFDDAAWPVRPVPGVWESKDEANPPGYGGIGESGQNIFTGVGWYRRRIFISNDKNGGSRGNGGNVFARILRRVFAPGRDQGRRLLLVCEGIADVSDVWVNGIKVGHHAGGHVPVQYDVTGAVQPGKDNILAIRIFDPIGKYAHELGGIWNEIYLVAVPAIYARRVLVTPQLTNSTLEADCWLVNASGLTRTVALEARIKSCPTPLARGTPCDRTVPLGNVKLKSGETRRLFTVPLIRPDLWSPTNPVLYVLEIKADGKAVSKTRFGFREFGVRDAYFRLNGRRAEWRKATQFHWRTFNLQPRIVIYNEANFLKRYLLAYQSWNANMFYPMATIYPRQFYDLCDEMGLLVYDEWIAAGSIAPRNTPVESEPDLGEIDAWIYRNYNHPSVVMRSLGSELFENYKPAGVKAYHDYLDPLFKRIKSLDKQNRPLCPSSGKHLWVDGGETDFCDFHFYPGEIDGAWVNEQPVIAGVRESILARYGREMPLFQGEFSSLGRNYGFTQEADFLKKNRYTFTAEETWDKQAFIKLVEREPDWWAFSRILTGLHGFRAYLAGCKQWERYGVAPQKRTIKNAIEDARRCGDLLQGIAAYLDGYDLTEVLVDGKICNSREYGRGRIDGDLKERVFVATEAYEDAHRVYNPTFVCLDVFDKNVFAGQQLKAIVYAMNDRARPSGDWRVRTVLRSPEGKRVADHTAAIGKAEAFNRIIFPYACALPADLPTGFYRLELFLYEDGRIVSDNDYEVFVLGKKDQPSSLVSDKRIALYDVGEKVLGRESKTTAAILTELNLKYDRLQDFAGLDNYQVLIIGAFSFDPVIAASGKRIQDWMEKGGRLLCFEQMLTGAIPFLPQMQIVRNHPNILTELVANDHPLFRGLTWKNFDRWNGVLPDAPRCPGAVFVSAISPLNETVVASGCIDVPRGTSKAIRMTISDVKIGAGLALLSQLEATRRWGLDSVAAKYVHNALAYILSDEKPYSTPLPLFNLGKVDMTMCAWIAFDQFGTNVYGKDGLAWLTNVSPGRAEFKGVAFTIPAQAAALEQAGRLKEIPLGNSILFDENHEKEFLKTHHDWGPLQADYVETFYFLHGTDQAESGEAVARYILCYADGSQAEMAAIGGAKIAGAGETRDLPEALNAGNGLFLTAWDNPNPQKQVKSLEVVSSGKGHFVLAGITCKLTRAKVHE